MMKNVKKEKTIRKIEKITDVGVEGSILPPIDSPIQDRVTEVTPNSVQPLSKKLLNRGT